MTQSRDFGPEAAKMRDALARYGKEELIDVMTHILRVYVLEENAPLTPDVDQPQAFEELARLTFPQLILHLQMSLEHEELGAFRVSGSDIFIRLGENEFLLGGPGPQLAAPAADGALSAEEETAAPPSAAVSKPFRFAKDPEPPAEPVTGEPDFKFEFERTPAAPSNPTPPQRPEPEPLGDRAGGGEDRYANLFGGGRGGGGPVPSISMTPPMAPPPIADVAPGDPSPEERRSIAHNANPDADDLVERESRDKSEDQPPPLSDGDKEIRPSNRFADLEFD